MENIKYDYNQFKDKSVQGIKEELTKGLIKASVFFYQSYGFPFEMFKDLIEKQSLLGQLNFYLNFRNKHPNIYD